MNSYEETKYLAEREVREACGEVPTLVVRPCAVLGDSVSGRTRTFNVIYYPLKLLSIETLELLALRQLGALCGLARPAGRNQWVVANGGRGWVTCPDRPTAQTVGCRP
jgi:nucleoside-diphosphate-sugar epimerase